MPSSPDPLNTRFYSRLIEGARTGGFPVAGALDLDSVDLSAPMRAYDQWLAQGRAGEMRYLVRGRDRRANPKLVYPNAQSILCVALPYPSAAAGKIDPDQGVRYARYLRGEDYHDRIPRMLETVLRTADEKEQTEGAPPLGWKICVDTSALLERFWAAQAGLGWIGKNSMLIHPQWGSYLLLGFALLDRVVGQGPQPLKDYCGSCTRCLKACPTGALTEARNLDSNRCISYWTLEKRGELALPAEDLNRVGNWVAGCDLCQEACPFNAKASKLPPEAVDVDCTELSDWEPLLSETPEQYRMRAQPSALRRVKPEDFARNLRIARSNREALTSPSRCEKTPPGRYPHS